MNKADIVDAVAGELDLSKAAAERSVNTVIETIKRGVHEDGLVQIIGFGTFTVRERKARTGRNPQTGETITIRASKSVAFKAGKAFKDQL